MQTLAEQLMAGPRGRALCLLASCFADERVSQANRLISTQLDASVETGWFSPGAIRLMPGSEVQVGNLVRALAEVTSIDDLWIRLALEETVNDAMYWQEPRGLLASRPELASALARIAEIVAQSPAAEWWMAGLSPVQYEVELLPQHGSWAAASPAERLSEWRSERRAAEDRSSYNRERHPRRAVGGEWWSMPPGGLTVTCPSPAGEPTGLYLVEDGFGQTNAVVRHACCQGRVLELDSGHVWADLCRRFPLNVTNLMRGSWYWSSGLVTTEWVMPDWVAVAAEYDAVHLVASTYLTVGGTAIEVEPGVHSVIAGWAPGDTYWLTDAVEVEPEGRVFVKNQDDDLWHPEEA